MRRCLGNVRMMFSDATDTLASRTVSVMYNLSCDEDLHYKANGSFQLGVDMNMSANQILDAATARACELEGIPNPNAVPGKEHS